MGDSAHPPGADRLHQIHNGSGSCGTRFSIQITDMALMTGSIHTTRLLDEKPPNASVALSELFTLAVVMETFRRVGAARPQEAAE